MVRCVLLFAFGLLISLSLTCCSGYSVSSRALNAPDVSPPVGNSPAESAAWPKALPVDGVQPWEQLDEAGHVMPGSGTERAAAAINADSEFVVGVERYSDGGAGVSDNGEATTLTSGVAGAGGLSWACYRLSLGSIQPGVVSADVNLLPAGATRGYYVGLSNYTRGTWDWAGPFSDCNVRLSVGKAVAGGANLLSPLGNLFVCVAVFDGAQCDVIGVAANPLDPADATAPPRPDTPTLTPVNGGLLVEWLPVSAGDLAGYRIYYNSQWFYDERGTGVREAKGLEGLTSYLLSAKDTTYIRISAVDTSGNESSLSELVSSTPLSGSAPTAYFTVSAPSGGLHEVITVSASGGETYDFDVDGDGLYEITTSADSTADVDTGATGILRPHVRAYTGGVMTAQGGVSLIIAGNSRPVASATASPSSGEAPLDVEFDGSGSTDFDGSVVGGGWDFDGDGIYDVWHDTDTVYVMSSVHTWDAAGGYNTKLRVIDNHGAWDVDTVTVVVDQPPDPANAGPTADLQADVTSGNAPLQVNFDASGSSDSDGTVVEFAWDWDGDGQYDALTDEPSASHTFAAAGSPEVKVRVEDNDGARATDKLTITVNVVDNELPVAYLLPATSSGDVPHTVAFDASESHDPDGSIVRYEWDFDGDGNYDGYGEDATIDHVYTAAGIYTAKLRVTDDAGAQDTDTSEVTVNVPGNSVPTASASAAPDTGVAPLRVELDGSGSTDSDGSIVLYEWDFDGDGVYDSYGPAATATHTYPTGGTRTAKLRVTDDDGAQDTDTVSVAVSWDWVIVTLDSAGNVGRKPSLVVVDGRPAVCYQQFTGNDLKYVRANDALGLSWGAPVVADGSMLAGCTSMAIVGGRPAISYGNYSQKYVRASDVTGASWDTPVTIDTQGSTRGTALAVVSGRPAIFYVTSETQIDPPYDSDNTYKYIRADDASGNSWGTPTILRTIVDYNDADNSLLSMMAVDGNPAVAYAFDGMSTRGVYYRRASDTTGATWGSRVTIESNSPYNVASLAIVAGNPAIVYKNIGPRYCRANDASGSSWGSPLTINSSDIANWVSLAVVNGIPVAAWEKHGGSFLLNLSRADDTTGSTWGETDTIDQMDSYSSQSMAEVEGRIAIAYCDRGPWDLKYAICMH